MRWKDERKMSKTFRFSGDIICIYCVWFEFLVILFNSIHLQNILSKHLELKNTTIYPSKRHFWANTWKKHKYLCYKYQQAIHIVSLHCGTINCCPGGHCDHRCLYVCLRTFSWPQVWTICRQNLLNACPCQE